MLWRSRWRGEVPLTGCTEQSPQRAGDLAVSPLSCLRHSEWSSHEISVSTLEAVTYGRTCRVIVNAAGFR